MTVRASATKFLSKSNSKIVSDPPESGRSVTQLRIGHSKWGPAGGVGATIHPLQATEVSVVTQLCTRPLGCSHESHQFWAVLKRHHPESHLQSVQADRYKTWEKNTDRTQTTGENIQTVYRP